MQIMFSHNFFCYIKVEVKGTEFVYGVDGMNTHYSAESQKTLKTTLE